MSTVLRGRVNEQSRANVMLVLGWLCVCKARLLLFVSRACALCEIARLTATDRCAVNSAGSRIANFLYIRY